MIAARYTPEDLSGKRECRADLLRTFGLEALAEDVPVVGIVSRFATQKGFDMVAAVAEQLAARKLAVVALGNGEPVYERFFKSWAWASADNVRVQVRYDEALAHKIEAGADIFLMPSRYEPCGLNQIYSLKYGTVPVVRATGGLDDTIVEWNPETRTGTGFKFSGFDPRDLLATVDRALAAFSDQDGWTRLMRNGMARDYNWTQPAREYVAVYEQAAAVRG
jgi:starch synthase